MSTNGNSRPRLGARRQPRMNATLRRTIDIALKQKDHTLATRFAASCDVARRDINAMLDAAHQLYWQAVEKAQNVVSDDKREGAQHFDKVMRELMEKDPVVADHFGSFIDLIASGAFMEGWIAGSIHCQEQRVTRQRTVQQRPGR